MTELISKLNTPSYAARSEFKAARFGLARRLDLVVGALAWLLASLLGAPRSDAQTVSGLSQPTFSLTDGQHVDLVSQLPILSFTDLSIGAADRKLVHTISSSGGGDFRHLSDSFFGYVATDTDPHGFWWYDVVVGGKTSHFYASGPAQPIGNSGAKPPVPAAFVEDIPQGETLVVNANGTVTFTESDGTVATFTGSPTQAYVDGDLISIQKPTGETYTINLQPIANFISGNPLNYVQSVTTNFGFQLYYAYTASAFNQSIPNYPTITAFNTTIDFCQPTAQICSFSRIWPTASYSWSIPNPTTLQVGLSYECGYESTFHNTFTITDDSNRQASVYTDGLYQVQTLQEFGYSTPNIAYSYHQVCSNAATTLAANRVLTAVRDGATYTYKTYPPSQGNTGNSSPLSPYPGMWVFGPTDPLNNTTFAVLTPDPLIADVIGNPDPKYTPGAAMPLGQVISPDGTVTKFTPDRSARVQSITKPEGGVVVYTYDARGNLTQISETPKPGSGLPARVSTANYDATCVHPAKCNKPNWVIDANGARTDYTYDPTSGVPLTKTLPSVATAAVTSDTTSCKTSAAQPYCVRPQTRFSYTQRYAWVKNASGGYSKASSPITVLTQQSECRIGSPAASGVGCTLPQDEIITTFEYGADAGPNNLFLKGKVVDATGQALRTCYAYDALGNKVSETSPRGNSGACP